MSRIEKIDDNIIIEVFNDYHSKVGYKTETARRSFDRRSAKKIRMGELYEVANTKGGRFLLQENILLIKDASVREALGLPELSEYSLTSDDIRTLISEKTIEELEDVLTYCSDVTLEKIVQIAIDIPVENIQKAKMIHAFSGTDVLSVIEEKGSSAASFQSPEQPVRRRRVVEEK